MSAPMHDRISFPPFSVSGQFSTLFICLFISSLFAFSAFVCLYRYVQLAREGREVSTPAVLPNQGSKNDTFCSRFSPSFFVAGCRRGSFYSILGCSFLLLSLPYPHEKAL